MNEAAGGKTRVLVVDDEPGILKVLGIELKLSGYETITTTSGAEAIDLVRTQKPDVVLLDVVMPGVTGLEVLERVRQFSQVPIIIFTGHPTVIKLAMRNGADDSIAKPFDPDLLIAKIRLVLHPHRARRGNNGAQTQDPHR
jgi:two-component system response regulator MtrA